MDQKWLEQQTEEIGLALAKQGVRLVVPAQTTSKQKGFSKIKSNQIASYIDHTLLKPTASQVQIKELCAEALEYQFASVCVNPVHVPAASKLLAGSNVKVCTVIGFPLGATSTLSKVMETRDAVASGAQEIDMVINVGALLERDYFKVYSDIKAVRDAAPQQILKVILETGYLSKEQIVRGCILTKMAGADFVKTSTGFGPGGATVEDIALMREVVGPEFGVKASGGVRDYATTMAMIKAGANRIGASAGIAIVEGLRGESDY
jgi:deoxyribose-phosphate aldolase